MSDLSEKWVREWAEREGFDAEDLDGIPEKHYTAQVWVVKFAREVLALRGAIGRELAIAEGLRAMVGDWRAFAEARTRERDKAVAVAREAIAMLNQWDESMSSYQQGTSDGTTAKALAARLAAITGGSDADS